MRPTASELMDQFYNAQNRQKVRSSQREHGRAHIYADEILVLKNPVSHGNERIFHVAQNSTLIPFTKTGQPEGE